MKIHIWSPKNNKHQYQCPLRKFLSISLKISDWPSWKCFDYIKSFQNIWYQLVFVYLSWWSVPFVAFPMEINANRIVQPVYWHHQIHCSFGLLIHMKGIIIQTQRTPQYTDRVEPQNCSVSVKIQTKINSISVHAIR